MLKALGWAAGVVVALALCWGLLHVFISPVNPAQEVPKKHVDAGCWACHVVSSSVATKTP